MPIATTPVLDIHYSDHGPLDGPPVMLLHGWPDGAMTWDRVVPALTSAGHRVIVPWLRAFGPTTFRDTATPRSGQVTALARDAFDLADALGIGRFALVGHDWGARAIYPAATMAPDRLSGICSLSVPWAPRGQAPALSLEQAQAFWYQWYLGTEHGGAHYRADVAAFERRMWDTWSPAGWYDGMADWAPVAASLANIDHAAVVLHFYRSRWGLAEPDPAYADDDRRFASADTIGVPTLVLHGALDRCCLPPLTEGMEQFFTAGFERRMIVGAGHFPQREKPEAVAACLATWLRKL